MSLPLRRLLTIHGGTGTFHYVPWNRSLSSPHPQQVSSNCLCSKRFSKAVANQDVKVENDDDVPPSSSQNSSPPKAKKRKKAKTEVRLTEKELDEKRMSKFSAAEKVIVKYIDDHNERKGLWKGLSKYDLKQMKVIPTTVQIIVKDEAVKFAKAVQAENPDLDAAVLELHSGPGLLTEELVNRIGFRNVTCMENCLESRNSVQQRFKVSTIDLTLDAVPRYHHMDKLDGGERVQTMVLDKIRCNAKSGVRRPLYMIGALPHIATVNFLIRSFVSRKTFFDDDAPWSGVTMFVALGTNVHLVCTATPEDGFIPYRATTVLFNTLFNMKEIGVIPRKAFIPWEFANTKENRKGSRKSKLIPKDFDNVRVFRIDFNEENIAKIGKSNLFSYFYFVRQHMFARTNRVIPELEKWIPGCGITLVREGFDIFTQIGTLQPQQIMDLYLQFRSWPEYSNSSFLSAVEKYQARMELPDDDDDDLSSQSRPSAKPSEETSNIKKEKA